jgi:hypothetical protein
MSHCILKKGVPPAKGILMDMADSVELFCYWVKDSVSWNKVDTKDAGKGMSVSEYRTGNVKVYHANDDDEDEGEGVI